MRIRCLILVLMAICFTSCGILMFTHKQEISDFATIKDVQDLDGYYLNRIDKTSILSCFNIRDYADFVTITSENPNEIKLIYYCDSTKQEQKFKGQMTKKYFEIYFSKRQVFIPFIYSSFDINRIRIGKTEKGQLLIRKFTAQSGSIFIFEDGYSIETPYKFSYAYAYKNYIPVQKDGLWGYSDSLGNIVIPIKYDFACIFEHDFARVKLNNKWGLINKRGEAIIPLQYDEIISMDTIFPPVFRVSILEKKGILDIKGNEIVPVIYDYIGKYSSHGLVSIRLKDKWGYANRTQVVIPAIYSELNGFVYSQAIVKRDGKYYIVDEEGYEYETTKEWRRTKAQGAFVMIRVPKPETKRKIQFEEQEIE